MASTINADTSNGVIITPDTSGEIELQANGVTKAKVTANGLQDANGNSLRGGMYRNLIINGDMRIDQRNAGSSVTLPSNTNYYTIDRFAFTINQASKMSAQQVTDAPTGFVNSLKVTTTSAYTVTASDYFSVRQDIEGQNISHLDWGSSNAKTVTLSFYVKSSLTGTFGGSLKNSAGTKAYPYTYTIDSANTWERKTITIEGETTGTWLTTNGRGIMVYFGLGVGSTFSGTSGSWASSNYLSATGATSVVGTAGATWQITGVQLEVGEGASDFEFLPYDVQLARCERYFQIFKGSDPVSNNYTRMGWAYINTSGSNALCYIPNKVSMRTPPSITASGSFTFYNGSFYSITTGNITLDGATTKDITGLNITGSGFPSASTFVDFIINNSSTTTFSISAEL